MNVMQLVVGVFSRRLSTIQLEVAREAAKKDSEQIANEYCDEFFSTAQATFERRLEEFLAPKIEQQLDDRLAKLADQMIEEDRPDPLTLPARGKVAKKTARTR